MHVTAVYDKRDAFNFNMVNFPYMSSNIPANRPVHVKHKRIQYCRSERDVTAGVHSPAILAGICIAFNGNVVQL